MADKPPKARKVTGNRKLADVNRPPSLPLKGREIRSVNPEGSNADDLRLGQPDPAQELGRLTESIMTLAIRLRKAGKSELAERLTRRLTLLMLEVTSSKPDISVLKAVAKDLKAAADEAQVWARQATVDGRLLTRATVDASGSDDRGFWSMSVTSEGVIDAAKAVVGVVKLILPIIPEIIKFAASI